MSTVYLVPALSDHGGVAQVLAHELRVHGVCVDFLPGTRNIWCRDWMPIKTPSGKFVKFRPKMDLAKWPDMDAGYAWDIEAIPADKRVFSDLILDGGNVVRSPDGKRVVMTYQTGLDNGGPGKFDGAKLAELLEAEIIWIPAEPGDALGHADGVVAWIDDTHCFVNDYSYAEDWEYDDYQDEVEAALKRAGVQPVFFPWFYPDFDLPSEAEFRENFPLADEYNPAPGYAINFLHVDDMILFPTFYSDGDALTLETLSRWFPGHSLAPIDCRFISLEGGLLHCVTWEL